MLSSEKLVAFVPTKDQKQARAFYEGVLGLTFVSEDTFALVLDANGTKIRVANAPEFKPAQFTILGWMVSDIETTVTELQAKGIAFEKFGLKDQDERGIWSAPGGDKVAWFKDPDGNILSVSQHI
ncbi:MAG: Glyoxalase/bleomycin resistance protein/dioxygenase [Acidobacteriaceae bacterium]|jgi:catechol 2,3-dioxygenase-like lactoylglutathione lyase family enzyme|nr:Glyoxalase/bleomycin resistance protein/dioxygenase [Acidobacteriaceae bacterium]